MVTFPKKPFWRISGVSASEQQMVSNMRVQGADMGGSEQVCVVSKPSISGSISGWYQSHCLTVAKKVQMR